MNKRPQRRKRLSWQDILKLAVYVGGALPLLLMAIAYFNNNLGFNPSETVLHRTGHAAVIFLLLSLACTPLHRIFNLPRVRRLRKPLGLFAAFYAALHFGTFTIWDYQLNLGLIWTEIKNRPFIIIGAGALLILLILAATSFRLLQRKMGKWWGRLHRLAYMAGILVIIHYLLAIKGDLFSLQGDYDAPLIAGGILILLFVFRIPLVHQTLRKWITRGK